MSEPIVLISHHRFKEGKRDAYRQLASELLPNIERTKPGTVAHLSYTNEEGTELHIVHVFPDARALDQLFDDVDERASAAYEFIEPMGHEIHGSPSEGALEALKGYADRSAVPLIHRPHFISGYLRPTAT
jgi:hypothetical protein